MPKFSFTWQLSFGNLLVVIGLAAQAYAAISSRSAYIQQTQSRIELIEKSNEELKSRVQKQSDEISKMSLGIERINTILDERTRKL